MAHQTNLCPLIGLALAAFVLTGCSDTKQLWRESEIRHIAEDISDSNTGTINHNADISNRLAKRVEELENKIADLEAQNDLAGDNISSLFDNDKELERRIDNRR